MSQKIYRYKPGPAYWSTDHVVIFSMPPVNYNYIFNYTITTQDNIISIAVH